MDGTMRAIVLEDREKLVLRELPIPQIGPDDILFRVLYASICGTDLPSYRDLHYLQKMPVVLGHEFTGVVVETGSHIKALWSQILSGAEPARPACAAMLLHVPR